MEKLDLEKFNPQKAELQKIVSGFKDLTIKDVKDKIGYLAVDTARKDLKTLRVKITKTGKDLRADARAFASAVIDKEKELVNIIEPTEKSLKEQQDKIDKEKEMIARKELLPARIEKLATIGIIDMPEEEILKMYYNEFDEFFNNQKELYLEKKESDARLEADKREAELIEREQKAKEEEDRLAREKREGEIKKKAEEEARKQAKEDLKIAKAKAEQDKINAVEAEKAKAEDEKKRLIAEQEKKEADRIEAERIKTEEEARIAKEIAIKEEEEAKQMEKRKIYKEWLVKNGYTDAKKELFNIKRDGNVYSLWKLVDDLIIE